MKASILGPVYTIPDHLRMVSIFISDWGRWFCLYGSACIRYMNLLQQSGTTLLRISRWYENDPVQPVPFCFTCKHRNPILNAPKPRFDNWMDLM